MKGKKFNLKIVLSLLLVGVAGFCFGVATYPKDKQQNVFAAGHNVVNIEQEKYSAMFAGDVIFSVEKVLISNDDTDEDGVPDNIVGANTFLTADEKKISFQNIYDEKNRESKTVVKDGEFIKLDNYYQDSTGKYYDYNSVGADKQQAVLISLGAYIYYPQDVDAEGGVIPESVNKNSKLLEGEGTPETTDDVYDIAGITYLEATMRHNGENVSGLKIREVNIVGSGLYFDFTHLILQDDTNEGYYELGFKYMIGNRLYVQNFSFYVINNLSYTRQIGNSANGYTSKPTLGWTDGTLNFERTELVNEYVQYNIGDSGLGLSDFAYPSITYDYTRYKLRYAHSANRKTTTYDYQVVFNNNKTEAYLKCTVSSVEGEKTIVYDMSDYSKSNNTNLVSVILTESGYYVADYEFLYDGYASESAPTPDFETATIKLEINGFSAYYSKAGAESAKLQYFEIARNIGNQVDAIIPNAYELDSDAGFEVDDVLGFAYKMVDITAKNPDGTTNQEYDAYREGNVLCDSSVNSEILPGEIYSNLIISDGVLSEKETLASGEKEKLKTALENIEYVESNQGSMSVKSSDVYIADKSFYYYSPTKITVDSLFNGLDRKTGEGENIKTSLDNTTTFNKKGYYLVFVRVNSNTVDDAGTSPTIGYKDYYQIFAFRYTSISVNMETSSGEALNKGNYTNESVRIEWRTPGLFDSKIKPYYYDVKNQNLPQEDIVKTTKKDLFTSTEIVDGVEYTVAVLGGEDEVKYGEFVKYVVRLENEGRSATEKMFVVDKQPITGIAPYVVQAQYSVNSSIYYSFAPNALGEKIRIENSITNGYATFLWDDKASGAGISVKYSYTPFVLDASKQISVISGLGGEWVTTNYSLGQTISGQDLFKSSSTYNVTEDCVLDDQGIYWLTFIDDAGNSCEYAFIIDRTENWFVVDSTEKIKNGNYLSSSQVAYQVGERKAFDLNMWMEDANSDETIKNFIVNASNNTVHTIENYYSKDYANATTIAKYFENVSSKYYFTVANLSVTARDNTGVIDKTITATSGIIEEKNSDKNEFRRTLTVNSENAKYSQTDNINSVHNSFVTIVINTDNALGTVFFSSTPGNSNVEDDSDGTYTKMDVGKNEHGSDSTSAKHVSFVWKKGTGVFEVEKVELDFYELKISEATTVDGKECLLKHYEFVETTTLYDGKENSVIPVGADILLYRFNGELMSKEGLYCVRRTYKGYDQTADKSIYGNDTGEREYYFIVDRNNIIDVNNEFVMESGNVNYLGENIKLLLQENEVKFNDFAQVNTDFGTLTFSENNKQVSKRYNVYLKTNRLPAVISVPLEKYFHSELYDENEFSYSQEISGVRPYYAGNLNIQIFYIDAGVSQFVGSQETNKIIEIFNSRKLYENSELKNFITSDGMFNLDIKKYLNLIGYNVNFTNKLCGSKSGNWIYLPGDYVIRITDNTKDEIGNAHEKIIALRIDSYEDVGPQAELKYGHNEDSLWTLDKNASTRVTVTTSQKYLQVVLTAPNNDDAYNAQLDQGYLKVDRIHGNSETIGYGGLNGYITLDNFINKQNLVVKNEDGSYSVKLDTLLDESNLQESLAKRLEYTITLRYILGNDVVGKERYLECYHYYNGNGEKIYYYETVYVIIIDRMAPSDNINSLNLTDNLVNNYCEEQGVESMFERAMYDSGEQLYFTYQYAKYYQAKKVYDSNAKKYLYIYHVDENTPFSMNDISMVYVRSLGNSLESVVDASLSLPMYSTMGYSANSSSVSRYGDLKCGGDLSSGSYYEIIEQDAAGNVTQYIIAYSFADPEYQLPVKVVPINDNLTDVVITSLTMSLDVFSIEKNTDVGVESKVENEVFFKISLTKNNAIIKSWLTNFSTDFKSLAVEVVDAINESATDGKNATFRLSFTTRKLNKTTTISLYQDTNVVLYASDLVVNNQIIIFNRANKDSVYATEIRVYADGVLTTFKSKWEDGKLQYVNAASGIKKDEIICDTNVTYSITVVSVLGGTSTYRFIAGQTGNVWHTVEFEGDHGYLEGDNYYGFANAKLVYNSRIYNKVVINGYETNGNETIDDNSKFIDLLALENGIVEYEIFLTACDTQEVTRVKVIIDKRVGSVVLSNTSVGILGEGYLGQEDNVEIEKEITIQKIATGALTLGWNEVENDYFDYVYVLYGLNSSKEVKLKVVFNGELYYGLVPSENYSTYRFEIQVYQKGKVNTESLINGNITFEQIRKWCVGNRVYAFDVKLSSNIFYEVRLVNPEENENPTILANSKFNLSEIVAATHSADHENIKGRFGAIDNSKYLALADVNYDLYLSYRELYLVTIDAESVVTLAMKLSENNEYFEYIQPTGVEYAYSSSDLENANLIVYEIIKSGISNLYVGILKINKNTSVVSNVKLQNGTTTYDVQEITSYTLYGKNSDIMIKATVYEPANVLLKKNTISMDILFIDKYVKSVNVGNGVFVHNIMGNGEYSFMFRDLAGNVHLYDENYDALVVNVVREVNVTINGEAPVSHGIYNDPVDLVVYKSQIYNAGSVEIEAYRNGAHYIPQGTNPKYTFSDYGNYRVVVKAKYSVNKNEEPEPITKTVYFSILNVNEARVSVDLTSMSGNTLVRVLNPEGKNVTNAFRTMMNTAGYGGANISYDSVMANASSLGVTSGKITFTVQYEVKDANYPTRIIEFGFTLNNEVPKIQCTLKTGESTKKNFSIFFNPQIIYEQVGDAGVYINGVLVASINENSQNEELRITRSFKQNGHGDYYVALISSSGLILDSYKVTIKEPLNTGAIILIVVIVAVVTTVVTVIIVLRRKMRIR